MQGEEIGTKRTGETLPSDYALLGNHLPYIGIAGYLDEVCGRMADVQTQ